MHDHEILKHALSTPGNLARFPHLAEVLIDTEGFAETIFWELLRIIEEGCFIASEAPSSPLAIFFSSQPHSCPSPHPWEEFPLLKPLEGKNEPRSHLLLVDVELVKLRMIRS
ncbi:hypothetical protein SLE2022_015560 [Rubroshorea leprosula]